MALLQPGDTFLGMDLAAGGHLTHGSPANQSGKWFKPVSYSVRQQDQLIDYDAVEEVALREKPKLIIAGGSAYSRQIDFARFRQIADKIGAYLMVDMAHFAGLVAAAFSQPRPARPCHHHHHPQDPARSARRHGADNDEAIIKKSIRPCSPACRAARWSTSSPPRPWLSARRCSRRSRFTLNR